MNVNLKENTMPFPILNYQNFQRKIPKMATLILMGRQIRGMFLEATW